MIELKNLSKVYKTSEKEIVALDGINLTIQDGEIFGIIGLSGAGKSTLVRCINLLERPTGGEVIIDGKSLTELPRRELLKLRQQIGMIFQGFNLLEQRNVIKNICFPLELAGVKKEDAQARAGLHAFCQLGLIDYAPSPLRYTIRPAVKCSLGDSPMLAALRALGADNTTTERNDAVE